ncbi:hypothetical protein [Thermococcus gorgonarius]|uniref:Uncharacterized protein n=1 Tax=Thermococcus gorgonarius TaxID=71997 RepID=A0A2Z2MA37_THEGO|nr:hypothetical protein [Thermococcus gorgonarius]ASJ01382.1 hypothetical protein A3K92_07760 [Thermococcus gorgonarius]
MNKPLLIMAIITLALFGYAVKTAHLPPASVGYHEVFYLDNQSVVFVEKDGWGLFDMDINPKVKGFEMQITFPEGTEYLIEHNGEQKRGSDEFKTTVSNEGTMYVHFKVPDDLVKSLYYEKGTAQVKIHLEKAPFWRDDYTLTLAPRKSD